MLAELGDLAGARTQAERALDIGQATRGPDHPDIATWHSNHGLVLRESGDLAGAPPSTNEPSPLMMWSWE